MQQQSSGLTVKAFCAKENLNMSNWCYWKRKLSAQQTGERLVPMQLHHHTSANDSNVSAKDRNVAPQLSVNALNIHFPNGVKVEFGSSENPVAIQMLNTMCQRYVLPE